MEIQTFEASAAGGTGPAETLVFLHGGNVAGWMWGQQVPAFADYRVLVPDLPGFGASNHLPWRSLEATADDLANQIPDGAHVVGLSLGSSVALHLAARHPHKVASLFLASAQVTKPAGRHVVLGRLMMLFWNQRGFWTSTARSYGLTGDDADLFVETGLGIRRETARSILDEVARGIPSAVLEGVTVPTIAVAGGADSAAIAVGSLRRLSAGIPGSVVATAPGLHHQWNIENVDLFNESLRHWLETRRAAAGLSAARPDAQKPQN
ncbi:alpha/beta fold hydrolase [Salinibacterium sp. G-O1]|uniref:alpha/beta fold hydrolase n=1 Tax=Salinibacterium sp. G-O1 TaxID=3046208 RepID=UPI0024BB0240|nr:alpha/beta fold hydrolase [Salinibacterium sp. G-O1]MDJ0336108.1 alpha/beta fold hydrolase [Salinibacterium sp. G-O1]